MSTFRPRRPSPALVVSLIALFVAIGGTSYAAFSLPKNSVGTKQLKNRAVATAKIENGAVTKAKLNLAGVTAPNALHADSAGTATSAVNATNAVDATNATNATSAATATSATHAATADNLTTLPSGQSESGVFAGGGGQSTSGYFGMGITYARPLATPISDSNIVDTDQHPNATDCPGPGQARKGYLCLYFNTYAGITSQGVYGWSDNAPYDELGESVGVGLFAEIATANSFADGVYTVTAP
jgi:hypothetical protein